MLYLPNCADADGTLDAIVDGEIPVQTIENITEITFADTCITLIPSKQKLSDNESGLCVLFQRENCDILITGDRSSAGEMDLLRTIELPELDVLVVGHHGSKSSTSEALLTKTSPEIAIISVGADNFYGHPSQDTLQRLEDAGCRIYRTDLHGTITFRGG
jgi:competence protein ComEC